MTDAVGAILALWLALAALAVTRPFAARLGRYDHADLLQQWDLFAQPRAVDLVLLRRDVLRDGYLTSWREVEVCGPRRASDCLWNPDLRARRAYLGMATKLVRAAAAFRRSGSRPLGEGTPGAIQLMTSREYLALLGFVSARSHPAADATQFMLLSVKGLALAAHGDPWPDARVAFVSEIHRVVATQQGPADRTRR